MLQLFKLIATQWMSWARFPVCLVPCMAPLADDIDPMEIAANEVIFFSGMLKSGHGTTRRYAR